MYDSLQVQRVCNLVLVGGPARNSGLMTSEAISRYVTSHQTTPLSVLYNIHMIESGPTQALLGTLILC